MASAKLAVLRQYRQLWKRPHLRIAIVRAFLHGQLCTGIALRYAISGKLAHEYVAGAVELPLLAGAPGALIGNH